MLQINKVTNEEIQHHKTDPVQKLNGHVSTTIWFKANTCYNGIKNLLSMWRLQTVPANMSNIFLSTMNKILTHKFNCYHFKFNLHKKLSTYCAMDILVLHVCFPRACSSNFPAGYSAVHSFLALCEFVLYSSANSQHCPITKICITWTLQ